MTTDAVEIQPGEKMEPGIQDPNWQSLIVRPLLIAVMTTCLVAGPVAVAQVVSSDYRYQVVMPLALLASLIGVYITHWLVLPDQRLTQKTAFRGAELLILLVALRLITWIIGGDFPDLQDVRGWILQPLSFFDMFFVVSALLVAFAWHRATVIATIFQRLGLNESEVAWLQEKRSGGGWRRAFPLERARTSRPELVESFVNQWLAGGMILVICIGLTQVRTGGRLGFHLLNQGISPQLVLAAVAYFLIGLVLASHARLAMLRAQWLFDGVDTTESLPARWQRYSMFIILAVGLVAAFLPLGSTWRAGHILNLIVAAITQIVMLVVFLFFALFAALLALFGVAMETPEIAKNPPALMPDDLAEPQIVEGLPAWLGGAGFWLVAVILVLVALWFILGKQGINLTRESLGRAWDRLMARIKDWWFGVRHLVNSIQIGPRKGDEGIEGATAGRRPWRFIRVGGLPAREKIRYFYLSTVRRAGERGVSRQPSQTPLEFIQDMEAAWPDAEIDLDSLTEAFVAARYDATPITPGEAREVQTVWQRIKKALRAGTVEALKESEGGE
ncbi:MAG: DUF4129 domain-containing protein [Chloroflexota bacterium]|nr:DUF4129 domain-containing protein [Chloroflexota bacterium]